MMKFYVAFLMLNILVLNTFTTCEEFLGFSVMANNKLRIQRSGDYINRGEFSVLNESLSNAISMAFKICQTNMKWERWNCPIHDFVRYSKMNRTKEQAFLESLYAASTMYNVIRDCFQGRFSRCKCFKMNRNCSSCSLGLKEIMKFGRQIIRRYVNYRKHELDKLRMHNQKVGIHIVKKMIQWNEKCISKTKMIPFENIADVLQTLWKKAVKLPDVNIAWFSSTKQSKILLKNELAFSQPSPDYCVKDTNLGINGTEGRVCLEKENDENPLMANQAEACQTLCYSCGFSISTKITYQTLPLDNCECIMETCCELKCSPCTVKKTSYYCSPR